MCLFNTETRQLETFSPLEPPRVRMYSCGPTVYDYAHVGNLRAYVFTDILKRTLEYNDYEVDHTINFTDFGHLSDDGDHGEDKIMKGLRREGLPITLEAMRTLTDTYIKVFQEDIAALHIKPPTTWARASDYVTEQIALIQSLYEKGHIYETSDGWYFSIATFPAYGRLGNIDLTKLRTGARVDENLEKKHPADFAVWKKASLGWDSPWGTGFPGWHIECSAMAQATLGEQLDIHTGGIDHIHTHHNAEIAQSEAASGKPFARYWLHNEFLTIDDEKISKSAGTNLTLHTLQERGISPLSLRYWLLTAHYRTTVNLSFNALQAAQQSLERLQRHLYLELPETTSQPDAEIIQRCTAALNDDLDTPTVIALLWDTVRSTHLDDATKRSTILEIDTILDLNLSLTNTEGRAALGIIPPEEIPDSLQSRLQTRETARINRDWTIADQIRDELLQAGYILEDTAQGPILRHINRPVQLNSSHRATIAKPYDEHSIIDQ